MTEVLNVRSVGEIVHETVASLSSVPDLSGEGVFELSASEGGITPSSRVLILVVEPTVPLIVVVVIVPGFHLLRFEAVSSLPRLMVAVLLSPVAFGSLLVVVVVVIPLVRLVLLAGLALPGVGVAAGTRGGASSLPAVQRRHVGLHLLSLMRWKRFPRSRVPILQC